MKSMWDGILRVASRGVFLRRTDVAVFVAERLPAVREPVDELLELADHTPAPIVTDEELIQLELLGLL